MKKNLKPILCLAVPAALAAALSFSASGLAEPSESAPAQRHEMPKEWREMQDLKRELERAEETLRKKQDELRSLVAQKHVKPDLSKYYALRKKERELKEADKELNELLKAAAQTKDAAKEKEVATALLAHMKHKLKLVKEADTLLTAEIQKLKNLPR